MTKIKTLSATEARNKFFSILQGYAEEKTIKYLIKKSNVPLMYIIPYKEENSSIKKDKMKKLLAQINKFRESSPMTSDSVKILRKLREDASK